MFIQVLSCDRLSFDPISIWWNERLELDEMPSVYFKKVQKGIRTAYMPFCGSEVTQSFFTGPRPDEFIIHVDEGVPRVYTITDCEHFFLGEL